MDTEKMTPEEIAAEQAAAALPKEDEVRAAIIAEFGFDEAIEGDKIDKAVKKEMEAKTKLSQAIGQKIKYRTEAQAAKAPVAPVIPQAPGKPVEVAVTEALEKRDLDDMPYTDEIKKEIQRVAQITGKTVKQAERDPYITTTFIEPWKKENETDEAAIKRKNRSSGSTAFSMDNVPVIDHSSKEAFEASSKKFEEWKVAMQKAGN